MGRTLLLVLALVAGSYAGPIQTEISTGDRCSQECTVSSKFNYEAGKTYEFQYENEIRTALQGASEDHAGIHMTAKVQLDFVTKCEVVMRISDVMLKEHDPETSTMKEANAALADLLERNPVRLSYQDGQIEHICLSAEEAPEIVNIRRGILSVFQNTMDDITKGQTVSESDVAGKCETEYTSEEKGWYNQKVKKSKNLLGCTDRHGYNSAIQGIPYSSQSKVQSLPLLKTTHMCEQELVREHGRLVSALCQERYTFAPFSRGDSGATTHNTQRLTFVSERKTNSRPVGVYTRVPLHFEQGTNAEMQTSTRKDLESKLLEVCETTRNGIRTETPRLFTSLVNTMKKMSAPDMTAVFEQIKTKTICADNNKIVKKFFMDAIPMAGTTSSLKMMTSLITSQEVFGTEADMWLTTLAFIQHPTASMLAEVKPLLSMTKNAEKAMLSVSSLVNNFCNKMPNCNNVPEVRKIVYALESKIASCKVTPKNFETILIALRSIGNTGFAASSLVNTLTLDKCIRLSSNPIEIRLSAIEALGMSSCQVDRSNLMDVFTNIDEDSEVRIAAYKALMKCPSTEILRKVKVTLGKEEVNQVGSYVWSHLTNLMETSDPHKQVIRSILKDSVLQKEFNMDKRKFSRNYEGSMFIEKINTGAAVEADLIWSSKSFIPRSAMANLTVDLFGSAVNLFEIGGRIEGLEYFLEAYFGPNGHFSENDVQKAADETALQLVKPDKVNRINKRMQSAMDDLRGSLYMKVFGNELRHMNFQGLDSLLAQNSINFLDILMQLKDGNDYQFTQSSMFLDSSIIVPTSSGFPLNLTLNGTATVDLKASGKMDVTKLASSPPTMDVHGEIRPSGAVMISSMMTVDAFVTKVGIKMVSTLHSNTALKGKVSLADGNIFSMELDAPEKKMEIFNVKSSFFTVHRDLEREQKMITANRQEMQSCTGEKLAQFTGLQLCGEVQFPNASMVDNAPYFPITGPVNVGISLNKKDSFTSYKLEARSTHTRKENVVRVAFSTPNGKVDRDLGINFDLNKATGTFDTSVTSPWVNADFKGAVTRSKSEMGVNGRLNLDNSVRHEVKAHVKFAKSGPGMMYTPTLVIRSPAMTPIEMSGTVKYAAWKLFLADIDVKGIAKQPVTLKTTVLNKPKMMRFSASMASGKNSPYSFDLAMQKTKLKTKMTYKPQISIRTPTAEVFAFGGNVAYAYGKNVIVQGVLDKVFKKKVSFKTVLKRREYRRGRVLYQTRLDFRSPVADFKMKTKLDNRNMKSVATDIDLTYVIRRYARDNIKFVSKVINLSTKALKKGKADIILTSKKRPEINFKLTGNVNHNRKHSEIEADFAYGANPKDAEKQVSLSVSLDRAIKSWSMASGAFKGEIVVGKNMRMVSRISHAHTKKSLDTRIMLRLNKDAISSSLTMTDKSSALMNVAGKFDLSYPGKSVSIAQTVSENKTSGFVSTLNARFGKSQHKIVTSWNKESPNALALSSDVSLDGFDPLHMEAMYDLKTNSHRASGSLTKGSSTYRVAGVSTINLGKQIEISSEIEYPSRHVIANFEGKKTGDKYTARTDLRWDANRDDTKRITLLGNGQYLGASNIEGSTTIQYPSRTLSANLKHTSKGNTNTHVDFKWDRNQQISIDTSFGKSEKKGISLTSGNFKLGTPFKSLKSVSVSLENKMEDAQYKTTLNVEWNPKQIISAIATVERPVTLNNINAELAAKTPFKAFKNVKATLRHNVKGGVRTVGKVSCNKKSAQFDMTLENSSKDRKTDIRGQLDIKSTFKVLKSASIDLSHMDNGRKIQTSANLQHNKKTYGIQSSLKHAATGWNVNNMAEITITNPSQTIVTKWDHSNTKSEITSTLETTWAKNKRVYIKYSGIQDLAWEAGRMSSALEIQTPIKPIRDIIFQINHQHRSDLIDSNLKVASSGTQLVFVEGKYLKEDGKLTSSFSVNDVSANGNVVYKKYPVSGRLEATFSPKATVTVDGTYNREDDGSADGIVTLDIPNIDPIIVTVQTDTREGRTYSIAKMQYNDSKVISLESTHRLDSDKMVNLKFASPFTQDYTAAISFQGTAKQFNAKASVEALPYVPRSSAVATFDSTNDVNGFFKIQTPFRNISYSQISFNSDRTTDGGKSSLTIEYVPGKEIEISSEYNLQSASNIMSSMEITTPFAMMPYSAIAITHQGDMTGFVSHAELAIARGKKIVIDANFSAINNIQGGLSIKTPFSTDIRGSFSHTGTPSNFQSRGDFTWGQSRSIDIKHAGTFEQFKSNFEYSLDDSSYAMMINFVKQPTTLTEITFDSPIKGWQSVKFSHSFKGNMSAFSNMAELYISKFGKFAADISADTIGTKSLTVAINTPYKKYSNLRAALSHDGDIRQFQTHVEMQNGKNTISADAKFSIKPSMNIVMSLKTPVSEYRSSRLAATFNGKSDNFKIHTEAQLNKDVHEADLLFDHKKKLSIDLKVKSPKMNTIKASLDHWGSWKKFSSKLNVKQGKNKITSDVRFQVKPSFKASVAIKSPFKMLKSHHFTLKHAGSANSFKCNMLYKCNGKAYVGDATFNNLKTLNAAMNLKGHQLKPINVLIAHEGAIDNFESSATMSMGKKKVELSANVNTLNGLQGSVSFSSPFAAFRSIKTAITHTGTVEKFKCHLEANYNKRNGRTDIEFDSTNGVSASIEMTTPFKGYEALSGLLKHTGSKKNINTLAQFAKNGKLMKGQAQLDFGKTVSGSVEITSQFTNVTNVEIRFDHEGKANKFNTNGEMTIGAQRSNINVKYDSIEDYTGSFGLISPYMKQILGEFRYNMEDKNCNTNVQLSVGQDVYSLNANMNSKTPFGGNIRIQTPFKGYETTEGLIHIAGSKQQSVSRAELTFKDNKHSIELHLSSSPDIETRLIVSSPLIDELTLTFELSGPYSNFKSAFECIYGTKRLVNSELGLQLDGPLSGSFRMSSTLMKTLKASFKHNGQLNDFSTQANLQYAKKKVESNMMFRFTTDMEASLRLASPFSKDIEVEFVSTGPISSSRSSGKMLYGGDSQVSFDSYFHIDPTVGLEVNIGTALPGYSKLVLKGNHAGRLSNFRTNVEASLEDQTLSGDVIFSPRQGSISVRAPMIGDVDGHFKIEGQLPRIESEIKLSYDNVDWLEATSNVNWPSRAEFVVVTPFKQYTNTRVLATNNINEDGYESHAELLFAGITHQMDVTVNKAEAQVSLNTPLTTPIAFKIDFAEEMDIYQYDGEITLGAEKHTMQITLGMENKIQGSISVKSPLMSDASASFETTKDIKHLKTLVKIVYGKETLMHADISTNFEGQKSVSASIQIKDDIVKVSTSMKGNSKVFEGHGEVFVNRKIGEATAYFSMVDGIDGSLAVESTLVPVVTMSVSQKGGVKDFSSHAEIEIDSSKHEADINWLLQKGIEGSFSIKSPLIAPASGKLVFENMNFGAEIRIKENTHKFASTLSLDKKIKSSVHIESPLCKTVDITFQTNKNIMKLKSQFEVVHGNNALLEIEAKTNFKETVYSSVAIRMPNNVINGLITVEGDMSDFRGRVECNWNDKRWDSEASLSLKDDVQGLFKCASPSDKLSVSILYSGDIMNFHSNGQLTINDQESEIDLTFNIESAKKGSLRVTTPISKPFIASFDHSGDLKTFRSVASVEYGQVKTIQATSSFSLEPLQGDITIESTIPEYETVSVAFNHKGHTLDFSNHAEFSINNQKTEADMVLNVGSKLEGMITTSSPYFPSTGASFDFSGKLNDFTTQLKFHSNDNKFTIDAAMNTKTGIDGSFTIKTPIKGYKKIVGTLSHTGVFPNVNSLLQLKTGQRNLVVARAKLSTSAGIVGQLSAQSILTPALQLNVNHNGALTAFTSSADIRLDGQSTSASISFKNSPSLEGKMSFSSPYVRPINGNFEISGGLRDFTANVRGTAGEDSLSGDVTFYTKGDSALTVNIQTPFKNYEAITGSAKYTKSYKGFTSDVTLDLTSAQKYEFNTEAHWNRGLQGNVLIKTPFTNMRQSSITANYYGVFPNIQSNVVVESDGSKYAMASELNHEESTSGRISIETPLVGYENIGFNFNIRGNIRDLQTDAQLTYATGQEVIASLQNVISEGKFETKARFESPYTEDFTTDISYNGAPTDFTNSIVMSMGADNSLTSITTLKMEDMMFDFESKLTTTIAANTEEQEAIIKLGDSKASMFVKVLGSDYSLDTSYKVAASKMHGKVVLVTPIQYVAFEFDHRGTFTRFTTKSKLEFGLEGNIQTVTHVAKFAKSSGRIQTSFDLITPFEGFETTKISYRHTASRGMFECEMDASAMNKDLSGTLSASSSPISATISITTPFAGYERLGADMKLNYGSASYATELTVVYMQGKTITIASDADLESFPKTATVKIATPFKGYENTEIQVSHNGDLKNFQSTASLSCTFLPSIRAQANLRCSSWKNMDGEATFSSTIKYMEMLKFAMRNSVRRGKYASRVEASWSDEKSIVLNSIFSKTKDTTTTDVSLSTPFKVARQVTLKSVGSRSGTRFVETVSMQYNDKTYLDADTVVDIGDKKYASVYMKSPKEFNMDVTGVSSNGQTEATLNVNNDLTLVGSFDSKTNTADLKYKCPNYNIAAEAVIDKMHPRAEVVIDNVRYGFDLSTSKQGGRAKIILPSRSIVIEGTRNKRAAEGSFMWDADADKTKQIGFRTAMKPSQGATKAEMTLMMPSIGKDVQIDSEVIVNRGRVLFEGKGELTYSNDMSKKFTITSRLEDISNSVSSKNYTFSLGISHPHTTVGIQLNSHVAHSEDKITGGFDLKYQTVRRGTKAFSANGEINKMMKSVNFDVDTPIKKISIAGNAQVEAPYTVSVVNKYDEHRPLRTLLSLNPSKKSINFQMNYDLDNPSSELHVVAKYDNSSAVSAEMFHIVNRKRVTDALASLRLNNSHLLHSRIHWRPDALNDLKKYSQRKGNGYEARFGRSMSEVATAVRNEAKQKAKLIAFSVTEEMIPFIKIAAEQVERFLEMYETNQYYVRNITDATVATVEEIELAYEETSVIVKEYLNRVTEELKERASSCLENSRNNVNIVLAEVNVALKQLSARSNKAYQLYSEHLYNMTRHPRVVALQDNYNDYITRINSIPVQKHLSGMADKYTSAIYATHDVINAHMASIMARSDVQYVKSISDRIAQQGKNAYTYWEIRENAEALANVIVEWIKTEIENELSDLRATLINLKKTTVTVYDPQHGEIQMEVHLPFPLKSLDKVPEVDFVPFVTKAKKYIPRYPEISLPSSDVRTWIPPFNAKAKIVGNQVTTFDGLNYDLDSECTFILTKDFVDGNFSIGLNNGNNRSLTISADGKNIVLLADGQVLVDNKLVTLPTILKNITIFSSGNVVSVAGAGSFHVTYQKNLNAYVIELNGWYFGKVSGLLGTYDNEPSNEMMTSFGKVKNNAERFSKSWDIGTARCR